MGGGGGWVRSAEEGLLLLTNNAVGIAELKGGLCGEGIVDRNGLLGLPVVVKGLTDGLLNKIVAAVGPTEELLRELEVGTELGTVLGQADIGG